jgi:DNA-binding MarR family transcriptional regulator
MNHDQETVDNLLSSIRRVAAALHRVSSLHSNNGNPPDHQLSTRAQSLLVDLGRRGPMSVPQLARLKGTSRQNIQILVNRLLQEGWLETRPNPAHKSSSLLQVTSKAGSRLGAFEARSDQWRTAISQVASLDELTSVVSVLERVRQRLDQPPTFLAAGTAKELTSKEERTLEVVPAEPELPVNLL